MTTLLTGFVEAPRWKRPSAGSRRQAAMAIAATRVLRAMIDQRMRNYDG